MSARTIVVGDIHGCFDELQELLCKAQFDPSRDRFISLGDIVDRGPKVRQVVDFVYSLDRPDARSMVLGNHEERMLKYHKKWLEKGSPVNPGIVESTLKFKNAQHKASFLSLEATHFEWMKTLPKFMRLPEFVGPDGKPVTLVHAGCLPQVDIADQDDYIRMHVSHVRPREDWFDWTEPVESWWASKAPEDARFWASIYDGASGYVVFGHIGVNTPQKFPHALGIDTGCCFGRSLSALILPDWECISVPSRDRYAFTHGVQLVRVGPEDQQIYS